MSQEWNIRSRGHVCTICQQPLLDKSLVVRALKDTGEGYERFDCHPECWKAMERDWQPFSQWDGVYFAPVKEAKKEPLKKEDAGELLRKLITLDDPAMKNVVYVLAVMLERSKILVERDAKRREDGLQCVLANILFYKCMFHTKQLSVHVLFLACIRKKY